MMEGVAGGGGARLGRLHDKQIMTQTSNIPHGSLCGLTYDRVLIIKYS